MNLEKRGYRSTEETCRKSERRNEMKLQRMNSIETKGLMKQRVKVLVKDE